MLFFPYAQSATVVMQGFILCGGMIIAFGPQNLFVLRQGLERRHLLLTVVLCILCDILLITLGVGGMGKLLAANEQLLVVATLTGATFLLGYGIRSLRSGWVGPAMMIPLGEAQAMIGSKHTIVATLGFSLLNPGAYLDAVLLVGTSSSRYPHDERILFAVGAILASSLWFFLLAYGAARLQFLFAHANAWRILDLLSGGIMVGIAFTLMNSHRFWLW